MRRRSAVAVLLSLCLSLTLASAALASPPRNFVAPLSPQEGVETNATGVAQFRVGADALDFRLNVANITDVLMAHIHLEGADGPVVAWLYPDAPPPEEIPGRFGGTLATGTITADDLVGPLRENGLDALIDEILDCNAYVNVHTTEHPDGEIAGAIDRPRGHIAR